MNSNDLSRMLWKGIVCVLFLVVAILAITKQQYILAAGFIFSPLLMRFVDNPSMLIIISLLCSFARFSVPGVKTVGGGLNAAVLVNIFFIGIYFLRLSVGKFRSVASVELHKKFLIIFTANLVITAMVRGFGLHMFGSDVVGGTRYIILWISIIFFYLSTQFKFSPKQMRVLIYGGLLASFLLFFAQFLVYKSGGRLWIISKFFGFATSRVAAGLARGTASAPGSMRYETLVGVAFMLLPFAFIYSGKSSAKNIFLKLIIPVSLGILLTTGFRRLIVGATVVVAGCTIFVAKDRKMAFVGVLMLGLIGTLLLYGIAPQLPENAQRALTVLPGINVSAESVANARHSTVWRLELYRYCLEEIPSHLFLGKGMLLTLEEKLYQLSLSLGAGGMGHVSGPHFNFMAHSYHCGALELLLDMGMLGFLSYTGFIVSFFSWVWKKITKLGHKSLEVKYAGCITIIMMWRTIEYYAVRAEFASYFSKFIAFAVMVSCILNSIERNAEEKSANAESVS